VKLAPFALEQGLHVCSVIGSFNEVSDSHLNPNKFLEFALLCAVAAICRMR
jgi:glycerol uptake facilitator-like aquaporin